MPVSNAGTGKTFDETGNHTNYLASQDVIHYINTGEEKSSRYFYNSITRRMIHMKIKPLADRVLVKIEEVQEKTASGIYIPQTAQEKTQIGSVVAVGEGTDKVKITVKVGDKVMHDKYSGTSVKADGEEFLILSMKDILAIIE